MPRLPLTRRLRAPFAPRWRVRNWVLAGLPVSMALSGWSAWATLTDEPGSAAPYAEQLAALIEEHQPGEPGDPDGWPLVVRAVERYQQIEDEVLEWAEGEIEAGRLGSDFPRTEDPRAEATLWWGLERHHEGDWYPSPSSHALALKRAVLEEAYARLRADDDLSRLLADIASAPRFVPPVTPSQASFDQVDRDTAYGARDLGQYLHVHAIRSMVAADHASAVESLDRCLALARAIESILLFDVAMSAESLRSQCSQFVLDTDFDQRTNRAVSEALARQARATPISAMVDATCLNAHAEIANRYTGAGLLSLEGAKPFWGLELFGDADESLPLLAVQTPFLPRASHAREHANEVFNAISAFVRDPTPESLVDAMELPIPTRVQDLTVYARVFLRRVHVRAQHDIARLVLAIEAHRLRYSNLPETLDQLVPEFLAALPRDPYNPNETFRYTVLDAPDDFGRSYWLHNRAGINGRYEHREWVENYTQLNAMNMTADFDERYRELAR